MKKQTHLHFDVLQVNYSPEVWTITMAERAQRTANRKKHLQIKKTTSSIWQHMLKMLLFEKQSFKNKPL